MVNFIKSWFSKTERSFYTLCILALIIFKANDVWPNPVTYGLCAVTTAVAVGIFIFLMYKMIKNG